MEHRKIVKIGGSYYVSLPKKWVDIHNLKDSSIVAVEARRGVLEIYPISMKTRTETAEIVADDFLLQRLVTAYLDGAEIVDIHFKDDLNPELIDKLEKTLRLLVGAEIVEESRNRIVIQCFLREDYDISSLIYRVDRITGSMYVDAIKAVLKEDEELAQSVISRDDKVDKLFFLIVRLIRSSLKKAGLKSGEILKLLDYRLAVRNLERIGDYSEAIAKFSLRVSTPTPEFFKQLSASTRRIAELQHGVVKSFINRNIYESSKYEKILGNLYDELNNLRNNALKKRLPPITYLTVDRVIRIVEELEDIAGLTSG
ncbi:MAG: hypothetical protein DRJ38_05830 [Thermoprotei archaeon]|nr:MAG: hypothetical protein DRJ38_05830 [Thermoprotei archaeon]